MFNPPRPRGHPHHSFSASESDTQSRSHGPTSLSASASTSSSSSSTTPLPAPPLRPPPLYSLIATGLHRCSAIGLEESLNEAWAALQPQRDKRRDAAAQSTGSTSRSAPGSGTGGSNGSTGNSNTLIVGGRDEQRFPSYNASPSTSSSTRQGDDRLAPPQRQTRVSPSPPGTPPRISRTHSRDQANHSTASPSSTAGSSSTTLTSTDLESSSWLSFLASLQLRTIVYLSPSLLPAALLKLSKELDLNFLQWDLKGGRIWNRRTGQGIGGRGERVMDRERETLERFVNHGKATQSQDWRQRGGEGGGGEGLEHHAGAEEDVALGGLDLEKMCRATVELMLNRHCGNVLVCDPSGLSEVSMVVGCLRRMMRWNFASVCLEYRAFAPTRSASTTSNLRFIELFPLETLELPDWPDIIEPAANALQDVQAEMGE